MRELEQARLDAERREHERHPLVERHWLEQEKIRVHALHKERRPRRTTSSWSRTTMSRVAARLGKPGRRGAFQNYVVCKKIKVFTK